jgi:hypothetical protein
LHLSPDEAKKIADKAGATAEAAIKTKPTEAPLFAFAA